MSLSGTPPAQPPPSVPKTKPQFEGSDTRTRGFGRRRARGARRKQPKKCTVSTCVSLSDHTKETPSTRLTLSSYTDIGSVRPPPCFVSRPPPKQNVIIHTPPAKPLSPGPALGTYAAACGPARLALAGQAPPSGAVLRSTCGGRWRGRTRRTRPWRSTCSGRWRARRGWSRRSRPSTCARAGPPP